MKKLILCLLLLGGAYAVVSAKDTYAHDASVLPEAARYVIGKNFKSKVSVVKIDKDFGRVSEYDVTLSDGTEITFDRQGNWKDVETNVNSSVPSAFYPPGRRFLCEEEPFRYPCGRGGKRAPRLRRDTIQRHRTQV